MTSQFLHGGWLHVLGNLLFLWIFGNNIEDRLGRIAFLVFYLGGRGRRRRSPRSPSTRSSTVPTIGASGAIAATLGAYLVLFPRARITSLVFLGFFYQLIDVPAVVVLLFWIVAPGHRRPRLAGRHRHRRRASRSSPTSAGSLFGAAVALVVTRMSVGPVAAAPPGRTFGAAEADGPPGRRLAGPTVRPAPPRGIIRRMDDALIEMVVESVRVHMLSSRHVVILKETGRDRYLPIWIGPWEASAIAMRLQGLTPERPLTHDLFASALEAIDARVDPGRHLGPRRRDVPRPALPGARRQGRPRWTPVRPTRSPWRSGSGAPIFAAPSVLDQAGLGADGGLGEDEGEGGGLLETTGEQIVDPRLDVFRDFVNSLDVDPDAENRGS